MQIMSRKPHLTDRLSRLKCTMLSVIHKTVENTICIKRGRCATIQTASASVWIWFIHLLVFQEGKEKNFHFPFSLCHLPAVSSQMKELSHSQKCGCIFIKGDAAVIPRSKECLDLEKVITFLKKVFSMWSKCSIFSMSLKLVFLLFQLNEAFFNLAFSFIWKI